MPHTDAAGVVEIKGFESCVLTAYWDAIGGVWTIGWGHTGPDVHEGLTWTQEQADAAFLADLASAEVEVASLVEVTLTPNQFSALVSFEYNTGALASSPGLALINAGNFHAAWDAHLELYTHDGNGNVVAGLVRRRVAEERLFFTP
jgi:lysozyme